MLSSTTPVDIAEWLTDKVAGYLRLPSEQIDRDRALAEYGLDSVYAMTLCGDIEDSLGIEVEPTLAWDYPTINAMSEFLQTAR